MRLGTVWLTLFFVTAAPARCAALSPHWTVVRFATNPIVTADALSNVNGPSVIRVPKWVTNQLGRYYLYFAHHRGTCIRLAYADSLQGPWKIFEAGALRLADTVARDHIASPDVHVDDAHKEIRMYFHGVHPKEDRQATFVGSSTDGLRFTTSKEVLGPPYFRVFRFAGWHYAVARTEGGGMLLRSRNGTTPFEPGPHILPGMRHAAVAVDKRSLFVFYSRVGDNPERILVSEISLKGDWTTWIGSEPATVLSPETPYEGADIPAAPSRPGIAESAVHEVRDPFVFTDGDKRFLFYSVAGERGIAVAELSPGARK